MTPRDDQCEWRAYIRRNADGEIACVTTCRDLDPDEDTSDPVWWESQAFWWEEGNGACDCNRAGVAFGIDRGDRCGHDDFALVAIYVTFRGESRMMASETGHDPNGPEPVATRFARFADADS